MYWQKKDITGFSSKKDFFKQKEIKKAREALKSGDKIVTAGGIHGRIKDISETTMNVEIAPNVSIKIDKGSVYPPRRGRHRQEMTS